METVPVPGEMGDDLEVTERLMAGLYRIGRNIDRLMRHLPYFAFSSEGRASDSMLSGGDINLPYRFVI